MELFIASMLVALLAETSYLVYRQTKTNATKRDDILLDTSVLIDGRILAIARSGLISSPLIVTRSVVRELQFMADKADHDKRERARFGLDIIEKLQALPEVTLRVRDDGGVSEHGVDEQLIIVAQRSGAKLCTIDYNLNKAARVQSVEVININELAHALRVVHLPGEKISVDLVQPGQDKKQAVGYLDDGTMVVVDDSRELIGQSVAVELTRVLQTAAGRMMFARRQQQKPAVDKKTQNPLATRIKSQGVRGRNAAQSKTGITTTEQAVAQSAAEKGGDKPTKGSQSSQPQSSRRRTSRRRTPEDKLVDLANK